MPLNFSCRRDFPLTKIQTLLARFVVAIGCALLAFTLPTSAQTLTVLYQFQASPDGQLPFAGLTRDSAGDFVGTTKSGGTVQAGTVYKIDAQGNETILYSFQGTPDGSEPTDALITDKQGNFYGTTSYGGANYLGTVFKLTPTGEETVLHSFAGPDGNTPYAALVMDAHGNLYGTTFWGGTSTACSTGCGTVFEIQPNGTETVIHSFQGGASDGVSPNGLTIDAKGNLYGTAQQASGQGCACGIVFKLSKNSSGIWTETILHTFTGAPADGHDPQAAVIVDAKGNLYGTTEYGGRWDWGTIFKITPSGEESLIFSFNLKTTGGGLNTPLVQNAAGDFFGTTLWGPVKARCKGDEGCGTVFEVSPRGALLMQYAFSAGGDGNAPQSNGPLLLGSDGSLYGTSIDGSQYYPFYGEVYKFTP